MAQNFDTPVVKDLLQASEASSLAVATTGTAYSHTFTLPCEADSKFALEYLFSAPAGTVDVKIQLEQSNEEVGTEGSSDANFVIPTGLSDIVASETTETAKIIAFSPVPTRYARFKFTGQGSNAASTVISRLRVSIAKK